MSVFLISSFLKGLTGLGFSTVGLGILATFIDLKLAIPLVFLPSLCSNILVMIQAGRYWESLKRFWVLILRALPGLILGIAFLTGSKTEAPKAVLGIVILVYGLWGKKKGIWRLAAKREKQLLLPVGLVSGLVNGATGSQIMPYLLALKMDREVF